MKDRKILELAAKAAGINTNRSLRYSDGAYDLGGGRWNPLTNDWDALRLAVKLGLLVDCDDTLEEIEVVIRHNDPNNEYVRITESCGNDSYAATRRAIVRAAAEIGRSMK